MAVIQDDRTAEEKQSHTWLVIGTDKYMSGWGMAKGGLSYAAWACKPEDSRECRRWVENRRDMKRVREAIAKDYRPGRSCAHLHIYVWNRKEN